MDKQKKKKKKISNRVPACILQNYHSSVLCCYSQARQKNKMKTEKGNEESFVVTAKAEGKKLG